MSNSSDSNSDGPSWTVFGNATCLPLDDPNAIWPYCPSEATAIVFAVLFGGSVVAHIFFAAKYRKSFCWVLIMATIWETAGYSLRALATQYQQAMAYYFPQLILILLSPLLINAFVYMVFARLVQFFDPGQKVGGLKASRLSLIFVLLDITSFLAQIAGASLLSSTDPTTLQNGKYIYMGGIGFQQFCILLFSTLVIRFDLRTRRSAPFRETSHRLTTILVYISLAAISVRIIFRLVEYSGGFQSPAATTESFQYIFDAVPMFVIVSLWAMLHPGRILIGPESEFPRLTRKQKKEQKRQKKEVKRQAKESKSLVLEPLTAHGPYTSISSVPNYEDIAAEERGEPHWARSV